MLNKIITNSQYQFSLLQWIPVTITIKFMKGGLFGLSNNQKAFLYVSQIIPTILVLCFHDLLAILFWLQMFYILVTASYIFIGSIEKSVKPYLFNEFSKVNYQIEKGISLGLSAFLLITIYGIIFLKLGKVVLPEKVELGISVHQHWFLYLIVALLNPLLEQWYWRLFLPKTLNQNYIQSHVINATYLAFHFVLFSKFLGFWRAVPFVGTFFSVGRSMSHIKQKYGIVSGIITHYGITIAGFVLATYIAVFTKIAI